MDTITSESCPLCGALGSAFYRDSFLLCPRCAGIFRLKNTLPLPQAEKERYETHNNDITDAGYRKFVSPITDTILRNFRPDHSGLDFGAGTGPVLSAVLQENGYHIKQYDPFFHDYPELLRSTYDYIACCEVIEHFHRPKVEFRRLRGLLNPGGALICMTHLYESGINFDAWYYKNDFTHVFLYQRATLEWIQSAFNFASVTVNGRLIQFLAEGI